SGRRPRSAGSGARRAGRRPRTRRRRASAGGAARSSAEDDGAGRVGVAAGHEGELAVLHLRCRGAADLPHRLDRVVEAVDEGLGELAAVGVAREPPVGPGEAPALDERPALSGRREAVILERHDDERREEVVEAGDVDAPGPDARHAPEPAGGARSAVVASLALVEAGEPDVVPARRHRAGQDVGGRLAEIAGALGRGDEQRDGAVGLEAGQSSRRSGSDIMREAWCSAMVMGARMTACGFRAAWPRKATATSPYWSWVVPYSVR